MKHPLFMPGPTLISALFPNLFTNATSSQPTRSAAQMLLNLHFGDREENVTSFRIYRLSIHVHLHSQCQALFLNLKQC